MCGCFWKGAPDTRQMMDVFKRDGTWRKEKSHILYPCPPCRRPKRTEKRPPVLECREGRTIINLFDCRTNDLLDRIELCSCQPWLLRTYRRIKHFHDKYPRVQGSAAFYLAKSVYSKRPRLLLYVDYSACVDEELPTAICPHKWVSAKYISRPRLYMDNPCATSFVIEPSFQEAEKGGWFVKFSTARFLRLFWWSIIIPSSILHEIHCCIHSISLSTSIKLYPPSSISILIPIQLYSFR